MIDLLVWGDKEARFEGGGEVKIVIGNDDSDI